MWTFPSLAAPAAVSATNIADVWSASYTIVAGAIESDNRNVSVTATDNAGNTTTVADTTNLTLDNTAPALSINQASGQGGPYQRFDDQLHRGL